MIETPLLELVVRGGLLYLGILLLIRIMPRRSVSGEMATMDLIFALLIAQAAAQSLGVFTSVGDGLVLIIILMGWNYLINALSYRFKFINQLFSTPPLQIIRNGRLLHRNLRREQLTREELLSHLREEGIDKIEDVKIAYVEEEGNITVVGKKLGVAQVGRFSESLGGMACLARYRQQVASSATKGT